VADVSLMGKGSSDPYVTINCGAHSLKTGENFVFGDALKYLCAPPCNNAWAILRWHARRKFRFVSDKIEANSSSVHGILKKTP
jgi:hypothetical protein